MIELKFQQKKQASFDILKRKICLMLALITCTSYLSDIHTSTRFYKVAEVNCTSRFETIGYKILPNSDTSWHNKCGYPLSYKYENIDTLLLIQDLLTFEGNAKLVAVEIHNYNPLSSQFYMGKQRRYSIQLEALFLINQLYFDDPFNYSPFPLLVNKDGVIESIDGKTLEDAYKAYNNWFKEVEKVGLKSARKSGLTPLSDSNVQWYF